MVYAPHVLVAFGGKLSDSALGTFDEIWNCNVRLIPQDVDFWNVTDAATYMSEIVAPLGTWFGTIHTAATDAELTFLKVNPIGADGHYANRSLANTHDYAPPISGQDGPKSPPIISSCISWRTANVRGPGSNGRIYLPNNCFGQAGSLFITTAEQNQLLTVGKNLLAVLKNASGTKVAVPVVASKVNATNTPITQVRIGNVLDVQRRRKDALLETYVSGPAFA